MDSLLSKLEFGVKERYEKPRVLNIHTCIYLALILIWRFLRCKQKSTKKIIVKWSDKYAINGDCP